jgi:preprotein translocase subunit SecB
MPALLEIDEYSIDGFSFQANTDFDGVKESHNALDVDFNIGRATTGEPRFEVRLFISQNQKDEQFAQAPYRLNMNVAGYFHFPDDTDEETIKKMIVPNGLAILYGIARGTVAHMTGCSRFGKLVLPSVNFIELIKEKGWAEKVQSRKKIPKKTSKN